MQIIESKCPFCRKIYQAEEAWIGQAAECPECGKEITIQAFQDTPKIEEKQLSIKEPAQFESSPYETKECPFCSEIIKKNAIKCRFCGSFLDEKSEVGISTAPLNSVSPKGQLGTNKKNNIIKAAYLLKLISGIIWAIGAGLILLVLCIGWSEGVKLGFLVAMFGGVLMARTASQISDSFKIKNVEYKYNPSKEIIWIIFLVVLCLFAISWIGLIALILDIYTVGFINKNANLLKG